MSTGLSIDVSTENARVPVTVFHITGDIDGNTYEDLQARAREALDQGTRNLLLDLSNVPYMSSAGLRALHYIFTLLRSKDPSESDDAMQKGILDGTYRSPQLKLLNPQPLVSHSLKVAGFDMYLDTYRNLKEALASF